MQCEKATYYQKNKALRTRRKEESPQWILIRENAQQGQRKRRAFREGCSRVESVAGWKEFTDDDYGIRKVMTVAEPSDEDEMHHA